MTKSLSQNCYPVYGEAACELYEAQIVSGLLLPADEKLPETVMP